MSHPEIPRAGRMSAEDSPRPSHRARRRKKHRSSAGWGALPPVRVWLVALVLTILTAGVALFLIIYAPEIGKWLAWPLPDR